jgi:hypothetical protein
MKPLTLEQNLHRFGEFMENTTSNISLILPNRDTCVKYERGFCAWTCSQQKPLSFFTISPPFVQKARRKTMTKTRKSTFGEFLEKQPQRSLLFSQTVIPV